MFLLSDSDKCFSFSGSESNRDISDHSDWHEIVFSGLVEPYQGELLAHSSDEDEDEEEDEDGLLPAILRARFEGENLVEEW